MDRRDVPLLQRLKNRLISEYLLSAGMVREALMRPLLSSVVALLMLAGVGVTGAAVSIGAPVWVLGLMLLLPVVVMSLENGRDRVVGEEPVWPSLLIGLATANLAVGMTGISMMLVEVEPIIEILDGDDLGGLSFVLAVGVLLYLLVMKGVPLLRREVATIPFIGDRLGFVSDRSIHSVLLLALIALVWGSGVVRGTDVKFVIVAAAVAIPALSFPGAPWDSSLPPWVKVFANLPHLIWFGGLYVFVLLGRGLGLGNDFLYFLFAIPVMSVAVLAHGMLGRLRGSPVEAFSFDGALHGEGWLGREAYYVDDGGNFDRLESMIRHGVGGVYGLTGVRGAGKSSLARHVVYRFRSRCFASEVTAPVRHDPGMGFFVSVCRHVCRKVIEDLELHLHGAKAEAGFRLWEKTKNVVVGVMVVVGAVLLFVSWKGGVVGVTPSMIKQEVPDPFELVEDPLLGETWLFESLPFQLERELADQLLEQIELVLGDDPPGAAHAGEVGYALVPSPAADQLILLRVRVSKGETDAFFEYRRQLDLDSDMFRRFPLDRFYRFGHFSERSFLIDSDWEEDVRKALLRPHVAVMVAHQSRELRGYLMSEREPEEASPPVFLSHIVLKAFRDVDPELLFDLEKLRGFREALRVYRRMLDGSVVPRDPVGGGAAASGMAAFVGGGAFWLDLSRPLTLWAWVVFVVALLLLFADTLWRAGNGFLHSLVNRRFLEIYAEAKEFQELLAYNESRERSAGFSLRGLTLGRKRTLASRDLTLPGLTARYTQLIAKLLPHYNGKIVIAIDELDKVHDPEEVKSLLSEIKGALFAEGCFYLISISEDAARSFRRRLSSGRDIFESTFDEVIDIPQMGVEVAAKMLRRREESGEDAGRLADGWLRVAALFGGGIPREIIRARRTLFEASSRGGEEPDKWAAHTLLIDDVARWRAHLGEANLTGAITIALRKQGSEALAALGESERGADYAGAWNCLYPCIAMIDPEGLRRTVGFVAESNGEGGETPNEQATAYREIAGDLQSLLRLLILVHLTEQVASAGGGVKAFEEEILECHRALADKPALAETVVMAMRDRWLEEGASLPV